MIIGFYVFLAYVITTLMIMIVVGLFSVFNKENIINDAENLSLVRMKIAELQLYIDEKKLSVSNLEAIAQWNRDNDFFYFLIYKDNVIIYESASVLKDSFINNKKPFNGSEYPDYRLNFSDKTVTLEAVSFSQVKNKVTMNTITFIIAYAVFPLILFVFIRKKLRYILKIEERISEIESGDMQNSIPVIGNDELSSLAAKVNSMTNAMREQFQVEEQLKREKSELISAVSHDIRTPLTTVISYLDLLAAKKVESEEKRQQYIEHIRSKAYLIKDLTDELFANSFSSHPSVQFKLLVVEGRELFGQLLSDAIFLLENENFDIQLDNKMKEPFFIYSDINQFIRVFDNLCSNIIKYADPRSPIRFSIEKKDDTLVLIQSNQVMKQPIGKSYGLGINTCENIITRHSGTMNTRIKNDQFLVKIVLPINP
ncbi:HAMP domain-containing histidine kinase [Paenibacillus sp. GSMTC-2017]|nr:HAMP domain-containing histidine kinase [Paenibacillus sp. GSMTC-2017]